MCRRFSIFTYDEVLGIVRELEFDAPLNVAPDWPARRAEAFPKSVVPLIVPTFDTMRGIDRLGVGSLEARELSWGFAEPWKPDVVFNTRIESAMKPTWRESMERRRCVVSVPSFFESSQSETYPSPKTGKPIKRQYEFRVPGQEVVLIGCIWRDDAFSMVTTEANASMAPFHHRMPLVVRQEELSLWLGPDYRRLADRSSIRLEAERA